MKPQRLAAFTLSTALALSGVVATSAWAAAPEWWVGGSKLEQKLNKEEAITGGAFESATPFKLRLVGKKVQLKCINREYKNGKIQEEKKGRIGSLILSGCKVEGFPNCEIESFPEKAKEQIETDELTLALKAAGTNTALEMKPTSGGAFVKFELKGAGALCSGAAGTYEITNQATAIVLAPQEEQEVKCLDFTTESGSTLKNAMEEVTLTAETCTTLGTEMHPKWSAR